ncbi:nuclease-related domain-containing protein [Neobacillus jeddahensis]|uniref:nuclease-related domain-containing protein n=1 Tax=Neobacillus jeddahensis TaxID=1461580 RepID=UPI000694F359|nr:nuclease-related domain-containing protein [Neobacillus jeddahensis]
MILNERPVPIPLLQREALLRRVPPTHISYRDIEVGLMKWKKGYAGEKNVDYYLSYLPEDQYHIINDLRLIQKNPFQIDSYIQSRQFGLILEIKNISGTLFFDQATQGVIRTYNGQSEGISNPLTQARHHQSQFLKWMIHHKLPSMPIEYLVVISKNSTILRTNPGNEHIFNHMIYAENLEEKVAELAAKYQSPLLKGQALNKRCQLILAENSPAYPEILKTFAIPKSIIIKGVRCPNCQHIPMIRVSASWYCGKCKTYSKNAHIPAIREYFLLMNEPLTVKLFQEFFRIDQRNVAKYLLRTLSLTATGHERTTAYFLPPERILSPLLENDSKKGEWSI